MAPPSDRPEALGSQESQRDAYPDMQGFSPRNLKYMRALAAAWPERAMVQQPAAQIPWGHVIRFLQRVKEPTAREC